MTAFPKDFTACAAGLMRDNVDTDTIIPSREMRTTGRDGLADGLFAPWRYFNAETREENPDFVLNKAAHRKAQLLLVGANFGCGSSREHAVWAIHEWGIRAIIAVSFAPIFRGNCIRNFVLPITLPRNVIAEIADKQVAINLRDQSVDCDGQTYAFEIEQEAKEMLLGGLDAIDLTLTQIDAVESWLEADASARPWVYLEQHK